MAQRTAAIRDIDVFAICRNPPRKLQELNSSLRSCAHKAVQEMLKTQSAYNGQASCSSSPHSFTFTAEALLESFLVDRRLEGTYREATIAVYSKATMTIQTLTTGREITFLETLKRFLVMYA